MIENAPLILQEQTTPGERILWTGRPSRGIVFHTYDILSIPAVLFLLVIVVTSIHKASDRFYLMLTITAIGSILYILIGRFILDAIRREHTYYGVTNHRVIIATQLLGVRVKSFAVAALADLSVHDKSNGSGTITFGGPPPWLRSEWQPPRLEGIPRVREVFYLLQRARAEALATPSPD